jgi:hypothetical protein
MWARKRIDIGWRDLLAAAGYALFPGSRAMAQQSAEQTWPGSDDVIACLSVRSGLDLMLGRSVCRRARGCWFRLSRSRTW